MIITGIKEDEAAEKSHVEEVKGGEEPQLSEGHPRRFGIGCRGGGRGGRGGRGGLRHIANQMVNLVTRGIMGAREPQSEGDAKDQDQFDTGVFGEKRSKWKEQRAIVVNKPQEPVPVQIGQVAFVPVEVLNQTKWPWKKGCYI